MGLRPISLGSTSSYQVNFINTLVNPLEKLIQKSKDSSRKVMTVFSSVLSTDIFDTVRPDAFFKEEYLVNLLPFMFDVYGIDEVREHLNRYPFLINLLLEAYEQINSVFGHNTKIRIETTQDPDSDIADKLFIYICVDMDVDKATDLLNIFDNKWWLRNSSDAQFKMNIDLEFL